MKKILKSLLLGSLITIVGAMPVLAATPDKDKTINVVEIGNVENLKADVNRPYLVNKESGQVLYFDIKDFSIETISTRSLNNVQSLALVADIPVPYSNNMSDTASDSTGSVRVKLTFTYNNTTVRDMPAIQPVKGSATYTILDSGVKVLGGYIDIYSNGTEGNKSDSKNFTGTSGSISVSNFPSVITSAYRGLCGTRATANLQHGTGSVWQFAFACNKVDN